MGHVLRNVVVVLLALIAICVGVSLWYVHEFDSRVAANQSTPDEMPAVLTPASAGEPYYILLLGSDWREYSGTNRHESMQGDNQRADVIILARVDAANNQVTLVSVPRDTRWEHDGTVGKINEAYNSGGAALVTQLVEQVAGVSIAHTVEVHFSGFEGMVNALGGIEIDVPQHIEYWDALTGEYIIIDEGTQVLDGQQAQIFARVRSVYNAGDETRQSNVRTLVTAIADKVREVPITQLPAFGLTVADCLGSDMRFFDFASLLFSFTDGKITMYSGTGPTAGDIDESADSLWLCYPNPEGWARVMDVVNSGGDPSTVDPNMETAGWGGSEENPQEESGESAEMAEW